MPLREEEWGRRTDRDLRYCVVCRRYLAPIAWEEHEHNPEKGAQLDTGAASLRHLISDTVYLGRTRVIDCASVLVVQGVEVFRLRDREHDNAIKVDLDIRGPANARIATVRNGRAEFLASGYRFEDLGPACAVVKEPDERPVAAVQGVSSRAVQVLGTFWVDDYKVEITDESLTLGPTSLEHREVLGPGTAIVLRKQKAAVGFAKR